MVWIILLHVSARLVVIRDFSVLSVLFNFMRCFVVTDSGLRDLVKRMRDSPAFWESRMFFGFMSNLIANAVVESDEKDPFTIIYLGRRVFKETPENEMQRQWWLANSEFREDDLDLIVRMADLFYPLDTFKLDDGYRVHTHLYFANSDD